MKSKKYDKNNESSYIEYLGANNLYGWAMSQKLPVNSFKWVKKLSWFNEIFIKNYNENSNTGSFLEVDIDYPKKLFDFHKEFPFLLESKKVNKVEKLICSAEDKEKYVMHIRVLKQALNHGLVLRKVHSNCTWKKYTVKVIGLFKDELGGKITKEFCTLRAKTYSYLMDDD